ncbi:MAG: hypothetical protein IJC66_11275, partial [Kiritimatiellae bacterium]|nr:hypothetical protein [Kiritimatiellia bacterium]
MVKDTFSLNTEFPAQREKPEYLLQLSSKFISIFLRTVAPASVISLSLPVVITPGAMPNALSAASRMLFSRRTSPG